MSKFCQTCGKALDDTMRFCDGCGASQQAPQQAPQQAAPQQPQYQQPVYQQAPQQPQYQQAPQQPTYQQPPVATKPKAAKKTNFDLNKTVDQVKMVSNGIVNRCKADKKFMFTCIGIAAVAVVVLVVLLALVFGGGGYTAPIDNAISVIYEGKVNKMKKLAPKEYFEYLEDEEDMDVDEVIEEFEDSYEDIIDYFEDEYGDNYKVTYEVTKKKALSDKKIEGIAEALSDEYDLNENRVTAGYELDVEITIKGSEDDADAEIELTVIKYKGDWYLVDWYKSDGDYYADFDLSALMISDFLY